MALDDVETFDRFRTLDSGAFADGWFRDGHVCRSIALAANTMDRKGHPLMHELYSAQSVVGEGNVRTLYTPAGLVYQRLLPGGSRFRPKDHGFERATLRLLATITNAETAHLQVETLRQPLQPDARGDSGRVLVMAGTGTRQTYELLNVPLDPGGLERIGLWLRGIPSRLTAGSVAAHTVGGAGQNVGQVRNFDATTGAMTAVAAANAWRESSAGDSWATDHYVLVHDGPSTAVIGNVLYQGQVTQVATVDSVYLWPPPANQITARALQGRYFAIYQLPLVRVFGLAIQVNDKA